MLKFCFQLQKCTNTHLSVSLNISNHDLFLQEEREDFFLNKQIKENSINCNFFSSVHEIKTSLAQLHLATPQLAFQSLHWFLLSALSPDPSYTLEKRKSKITFNYVFFKLYFILNHHLALLFTLTVRAVNFLQLFPRFCAEDFHQRLLVRA